MKKIVLSVLFFVLFAYAGSVNVNIESSTVNLGVPNDGQVHVIYLPANVSLSNLQNALSDDQTLIIYNLAAYSSWMEQFTGKKFISAIKITKDGITYLKKVDDNSVEQYNSYNSFVSSIANDGLVAGSGFDLNNYWTYFSEIKAGGVYYIKSSGSDLTFKLNFGTNGSSSESSSEASSSSQSSSSSSTGSSSSAGSSSNGLETPPSPPGFDESGSSSSDDLMMPPSVPNF